MKTFARHDFEQYFERSLLVELRYPHWANKRGSIFRWRRAPQPICALASQLFHPLLTLLVAASFAVSASDTTIGLPEADGTGGGTEEAEGKNAAVRPAEEANALAARYRSLLQHKGHMSLVLQVLAVSEQAGAALRSGTVESRRGKGAQEALKVRPGSAGCSAVTAC